MSQLPSGQPIDPADVTMGAGASGRVIKRARLHVLEGDAHAVEGSDRRGQEVVAPCRLCTKVKKLQLSHIAPRWVGKWMKNEGKPISDMRPVGVRVVMQDLEKQYLLCSECEQWLGVAENYLSMLTRGGSQDLQSIGVELWSGPILVGVDPKMIRRAVLGVLFKGFHASALIWSSFQPPRKMVDALRTRLLTDAYDSNSHPLYGTKWMSCVMEGANARAMQSPGWVQRPGLTAFDLMMAGWSWTVVFRGWVGMVRSQGVSEAYNLGNGPWRVMMGEVAVSRLMTGGGAYDIAGDNLEGWRNWPDGKSCPCGSGNSFKTCCRDTWCAE